MCNSWYLWNYQPFRRMPLKASFLIRHVQSYHFRISIRDRRPEIR